MSKNYKWNCSGWMVLSLSLAALLATTWQATPAWAQGKGGGGGGGGGGGTTPPASLLVTLGTINGTATAMNDVNHQTAQLVGMLGDDIVHWTVTGNTTGASVTVRTLPPLLPPHWDGSWDFYYRARDINNQGNIAGYQRDRTEPRVTPLLWMSSTALQPLVLPVPDLFEDNEYDENDQLIFDDENVWATSISNDGFVLGYARHRPAKLTTELEISFEPKTFTIGLGLQWTAEQKMLVAYNDLNYMILTVTSYNINTGEVEGTVDSFKGEGTYEVWSVSTFSGDGENPSPFPNDYLIVWKFDTVDGNLVVQAPFAYEVFGRITNRPEISATNGHIVWDEDNTRALRMQVAWVPGSPNGGNVVVTGSESLLFYAAGTAVNVNSSGTAVGYSGGTSYAIEPDGTLVSIPTLPGFRLQGNRFEYRAPWARDINNSRWVLTSQYPVNVSHGGSILMSRATDVVSELGGTAIDLKTYAENWDFGSARNINAQGWITGSVRVNGEFLPALIIR